MSGMSGAGNYTGQNVQPYASSVDPKNSLVDKYFPQIEAKLQERGAKALLPAGQSTLYDHLNEEGIKRELEKVRDEFLQEAGKLEAERMVVLEAQCEEKYRSQLEEIDKEVNKAYRIINIQNAILTKIFESNKDALLNVIKDLDITEKDLEILASGGKL